MGRGRAPCCDKSKVKSGPWSPSEDLKLVSFIRQHGHDNWRALPKLAGLARCGKSCRLRWINYLRPDVKRGNFTKEEEETILRLHKLLGNKWSKIASHLPGRTDNEIKNIWNTYMKKKLSVFSDVSTETSGDKSKQGYSLVTSSSSSSPSNSFTGPRGRVGNGTETEYLETDDMKTTIIPASGFVEEVGEPDTIPRNDVLEIPVQFDADFWDLLDEIGTSPNLQTNEVEQILEADACWDPQLGGQEASGDTEKDKWMQYIEYELGLADPTIEEGDQKSID